MRDTLVPGHDLSSEAGWRRLRAQYYGNVTLVDRMVGRITAALERAGVADDTAVVFTTDHGEMLGDHWDAGEAVPFTRRRPAYPLLMRVPWLSSGQHRVEGSVGHVDLVPTMLDLLSESLPDHVEGKSLVPVLRGEETLAGNDVFIEWNGISPTVRDRFLGSGRDQPNVSDALSIRGVGSVEVEPLRGRSGRVVRPPDGSLRTDQSIRRPRPTRPRPRHGRTHTHVAARNGRRGGAAGCLNKRSVRSGRDTGLPAALMSGILLTESSNCSSERVMLGDSRSGSGG